MVIFHGMSHRRRNVLLFSLLAIVLVLTLLAAGFLRPQDFMSSLLNSGGDEGILLQITQNTPLRVGDEVKVSLQVRSNKQISKVVSSLYYNPKILQYKGAQENDAAYMGFLLAQVKPEAGWLYFADGRKDPQNAPRDETFVTLIFQAIAPGDTALNLDADISKFAVGNDFVPERMNTGFQAVPDALSTIQAPTFTIATNGGSSFMNKPTLPYTIQVSNLGASNKITSFKLREQTGTPVTWTSVPSKVFDRTSYTQDLTDKDGAKQLTFQFTDSFGNTYESKNLNGTEPYAALLYLDRKAPNVSDPAAMRLVQGLNILVATSVTNLAQPTIGWRYIEEDLSGIAMQTLQAKQNGVAVGSLVAVSGTSYTMPALPDGTYTVEMQVTDKAGNSKTVNSAPFQIDTTAPKLASNSLAQETTSATENPRFRYSNITETGSGLAELTIKIQRDKETTPLLEQIVTANATPIITLSRGLDAGTYQTWLKARDKAGNESFYEKSISFTLQNAVGTGTGTSMVTSAADAAEINRLRIQVTALNAALNAGNADLRRLNGAQTPTSTSPTSSTSPSSSTVLSTATTQTTFRDVTPSHWAWEYLQKLQEKGVMTGYPDNTLRPNDNVTRAELLKMVLTANKTPTENRPAAFFRDTKLTDWYAPFLNTGVALGILSGYNDSTFRPNNSVTRAEALKIVLEANKVQPQNAPGLQYRDVATTDWFAPYVNTAYQTGLVKGYADGTFKPYQPITRAEAAKIISSYLK